ncbi:chromo domain-containing protein [Paraclostridium dentum]|uniref:chromo domain-containing protein n=1 Tax=Paraclostridium dentum TaxID=2662455 RepID=UPI003F3D3EEE
MFRRWKKAVLDICFICEVKDKSWSKITPFRKGYEQTFSDEYFTISECVAREPPVYRLVDCAGEILQGTFYEKELQRVIVDKDKVFKIEKILDRKKVGREKYVLVKWLGWPENFNSLIPEKDVIDLY